MSDPAGGGIIGTVLTRIRNRKKILNFQLINPENMADAGHALLGSVEVQKLLDVANSRMDNILADMQDITMRTPHESEAKTVADIAHNIQVVTDVKQHIQKASENIDVLVKRLKADM